MTCKSEQQIMVVSIESLFGNDYFEGFIPHTEKNYEVRVLENFDYARREYAERNQLFKQPIRYCLIVNPELQKVFAYQRSEQNEKYPEKRLQGKWSWGVGGHIEKVDTKSENPIHESMQREIREEVDIRGSILGLKVLGYINDDSDEVGRVHFGILYAIITNARIVEPEDPEIDNGGYRTIEELEEICQKAEVEGWSKIALRPLEELLLENIPISGGE